MAGSSETTVRFGPDVVIEHAVDVDRQRARVHLAAEVDAGVLDAAPFPGDLQVVEVGGVDLIERRIPCAVVAAGDVRPFPRLLGDAVLPVAMTRRRQCGRSESGSDRERSRARSEVRASSDPLWLVLVGRDDSVEKDVTVTAALLVNSRGAGRVARRGRLMLQAQGSWRSTRSADRPRRPRRSRVAGSAALFAVPFALTAALFLLSFLPRVQSNVVLVQVLLGRRRSRCSSGRRCSSAPAASRPSIVLAPPRPQHYVQAMCHMSVYAYWGWYWRAGLRLRLAAGRAARVRLRVRHAAVVVAPRQLRPRASGRFRSSSARTCSCGSGTTGSTCSSCSWPSGSSARSSCAGSATGRRVHIFNPSAFCLGALLGRPDRDRHHAPHVGAGDRVDAEPRAVHLRVPVPRRPGRDVLLLDHARSPRPPPRRSSG